MYLRTKTNLTGALWLLPLWLMAQSPLTRQVDFFCRDCRAADALVLLSRETGVNIVFSDRLFEQCPRLNIQAKGESLRSVLDAFAQCGRASYKVLDDQIVFSKKINRYTLSGYVQDAESGERLIGASVRVLTPSGPLGATSNEFGFFSLKLEEGEYTVLATYVGYQLERSEQPVNGDRILRLKLRPLTALPEIVIPSVSQTEGREKKSGSPRYLDLAVLRSLPMPGGEADLLRQAALEAGVQTGTDGLGGLHVRGGNADQNLFLLDDVPVYSPSHALGLFSVFNPSTVSSARLWKGDFPARYSGRAASVLDVRTRDGDSRRFKGELNSGLFASSAVAEGPIKRDKGSFLIGGRMTYFDPWVKFFSKRGNLLTFSGDEIEYQFFDSNLKLNYTLSDRDRVFFSFYKGGDSFHNIFKQAFDDPQGYITDQSELTTEWGNDIAALRWNHLLRDNLFTNTTIRFSRFVYESRLGFKSDILYPNGKQFVLADYGQFYRTLIRDWSGKTDFTFFVSDAFTMRWGASFTSHQFQPGTLSANFLQPGQSVDSLTNILINDDPLEAEEVEAYLDAEWKFHKNWLAELGLNGSVFQTDNTNYRLLQPRLRLRHVGDKGWSQWIGWHRMAQNLHQIGTFNVSLPFELWVPSTKRVPPEIVWQASAGFGKQYETWGWQIEGYYKEMPRALTFIAYNDALFTGGAVDASGWEDRITIGTGKSKGLEILAEKTAGKFRGSIAYTLSKTDRFFPELNAGRPFPFRFDRRHDLKISLRQQVFPWMDADVVWVVASGNPITLAGVKFRHESVEGAVQRDVFFYTEVNGYRLPVYHRLDLALNARWGRGKWKHSVQIGAFNSYNRANPFYLYVDAGSSVKGKAIQYTLLPLLPSLRYTLQIH